MSNFDAYYAYTVKRNDVDYPMPYDYEEWLQNASNHGFQDLTHYYEFDSKGKLHMHGIGSAPVRFYKKKTLLKGYHQKIDILPTQMDMKRYADYIQKDYTTSDAYEQKILQYVNSHTFNFI